MSKKYSFFWVELQRIVRDLQQELDRDPGPDWGRVKAKAKDLDILAKSATRDEQEPAVPARRRRFWFLGRR